MGPEDKKIACDLQRSFILQKLVNSLDNIKQVSVISYAKQNLNPWSLLLKWGGTEGWEGRQRQDLKWEKPGLGNKASS